MIRFNCSLCLTALSLMLGMGSPQTVQGDSDNHHQRSFNQSVPPGVHKAWMRWIPDNVSLFAISIPATHDSITYTVPSGNLCETQWMDIIEQMNAGIRSFDIRASRQKNPDRLELYHGDCALYRDLDDILKHMAAFLKTNNSETLILRLGDDGIDGGVGHDSDKSMQELFELHRCNYKDAFWNPKATDPIDNPPCDIPKTNPLNTTHTNPNTGQWLSPTLGEVRGKIVLLREAGWGSQQSLELGLHKSQNHVFSRYDLNAGCDDWEDTVYGAGGHLKAANFPNFPLALDPTAPRTGFTLAQLDAVSGACYPYTASEWINREFYRFLVGYSDMENGTGNILGSFSGKSTGMVSMDFPGPGLIDAIIAHNLHLVSDPKLVGKEFDTIFENTWYAIEEDRPDDDNGNDDARDRWEAFGAFWNRLLPGYYYQLSVMRMDGHKTARATNALSYPAFAAELKNDWHVFFYADTKPPPPSPTQTELQTFVDNWYWTAQGPWWRASSMRDLLNATWPNVVWTVIVYLEKPFGFDNLTVGGNAGVHALSKSINNTRYYVSGIRVPIPPLVAADAGGPYVALEGPQGGVILFPGPGTSNGGTTTLQWRWDLDNDGEWDTPYIQTPMLPIFKPDDYSGTVRLQVSNGLTTKEDVTTIDFLNAPPDLYPTSGSSWISEGAQATINGTIADVGADSMTVSIDWTGDGIDDTTSNLPFLSDKCALSPSEYCTTFSEKHVYSDNGPGPLGEILARVTVEDDDGGVDTFFHKITVSNKAPSVFTPFLIKVGSGLPVANNEQIPPGTELQVSVEWSDVAADQHSARIEWGDGTITPFGNLIDSPLVSKHTYVAEGARQIRVVIKDDDNAFTYKPTVPFWIGVPPDPPLTPPTADGGGPYSVNEGSAVILDGSGSMVHGPDPAQYRWDFDGDLTWDTTRSTDPLSQPWYGPDPERPNDFSTNNARLGVFDGVTEVIDANIKIDILNVAPSISTTVNQGDEGDLFTYTIEVSDPGWDFHDVNIDYDGDEFFDEFLATIPPGESTVIFNHVFEDEPFGSATTYPVEVWAFDRKAGGVREIVPTTVFNISPTADIDSVSAREVDRVPALPPDTQDYFVVNTALTLTGHWSDPGIEDKQTITINWGDGNTSLFENVAHPNTAIVAKHTYATVGDRIITLKVVDIDAGESQEASWPVSIVDRPDETESIHNDGFESD